MPRYRTPHVDEVWSNGFKGHGNILCNACNKPLRDHEISQPCPELKLKAGQLTVPKIGKRHVRHDPGLDAKEKK